MEKSILKIVPGVMALGVVGHSMKALPKIKMDKGRTEIKPVKLKTLVKVGIGTMIAVPLLKGISAEVSK
jgi:hypothetical protein